MAKTKTNTLNKSEADKFLAELESDLRGAVQTEVAALRKSATLAKADAPPPKEEEAPVEEAPAADAGPAEGAPPEAEPAGPPAGAPPGMDAGAPPGADAGMPPGGAPGMDPAAGGEAPMSPEELQAEYAKLPPEELMQHYKAAKEAVFALMGGGAGDGAMGAAPGMDAGAPPGMPPGGAPPGMPPAGPDAGSPPGGMPPPGMDAGAPPPAAPGMPPEEEKPMPAMKSEDMSKAEITDLKTQVAEMQAVILKMATQPVRKAVTAADYVAKPTEEAHTVVLPNLTKSQAMAKLSAKATELSKKERALVNEYVFGNKSLQDVAHLLKD